MPTYRSASGSSAEDLFIELFSDTFGAEKAGYLYSQHLFFDIYRNSRFADFLRRNAGGSATHRVQGRQQQKVVLLDGYTPESQSGIGQLPVDAQPVRRGGHWEAGLQTAEYRTSAAWCKRFRPKP